jgi:hypothetical protein
MNSNQKNQNGPRRRNTRRRGRGGRQNATANLPQFAPSNQALSTRMSQPNYYPTVAITRVVTGLWDVVNDGINPSLYAFTFQLASLPAYGDFTSLFQTYCIEQIEAWWRPEYTELTDASVLSNAINVEFSSAIDTINSTTPAAVTDVYQYQNCAHTGITQNHYRKFKPSYLMDNVIPTCARTSCDFTSLRWIGVKVTVPPCGVAMTFRSTLKVKLALTGAR